jgi:hypothetical protein
VTFQEHGRSSLRPPQERGKTRSSRSSPRRAQEPPRAFPRGSALPRISHRVNSAYVRISPCGECLAERHDGRDLAFLSFEVLMTSKRLDSTMAYLILAFLIQCSDSPSSPDLASTAPAVSDPQVLVGGVSVRGPVMAGTDQPAVFGVRVHAPSGLPSIRGSSSSIPSRARTTTAAP